MDKSALVDDDRKPCKRVSFSSRDQIREFQTEEDSSIQSSASHEDDALANKSFMMVPTHNEKEEEESAVENMECLVQITNELTDNTCKIVNMEETFIHPVQNTMREEQVGFDNQAINKENNKPSNKCSNETNKTDLKSQSDQSIIQPASSDTVPSNQPSHSTKILTDSTNVNPFDHQIPQINRSLNDQSLLSQDVITRGIESLHMQADIFCSTSVQNQRGAPGNLSASSYSREDESRRMKDEIMEEAEILIEELSVRFKYDADEELGHVDKEEVARLRKSWKGRLYVNEGLEGSKTFTDHHEYTTYANMLLTKDPQIQPPPGFIPCDPIEDTRAKLKQKQKIVIPPGPSSSNIPDPEFFRNFNIDEFLKENEGNEDSNLNDDNISGLSSNVSDASSASSSSSALHHIQPESLSLREVEKFLDDFKRKHPNIVFPH